jgi:predicted methyltransferase
MNKLGLAAAGCAAACAMVLSAAAADGAATVPSYVSSAVAEPTRPDRDKERDALRHPAEVITFAGIRPGQRVAELQPGPAGAGGYFTRILCRVVGAKGHIYAINFKLNRPPGPAAAPVTPNPCTNVTFEEQAGADFKLPGRLDAVWTSENYHDFHNAMFGIPDIKAMDQKVFDALRPGGVFVIEDHVAPSGSGASDTNTLHRIDPDLVKQELTAVGFEFAGSSDVLHNANDPHTDKVFALHGQTDKFLFKFRKPRK